MWISLAPNHIFGKDQRTCIRAVDLSEVPSNRIVVPLPGGNRLTTRPVLLPPYHQTIVGNQYDLINILGEWFVSEPNLYNPTQGTIFAFDDTDGPVFK